MKLAIAIAISTSLLLLTLWYNEAYETPCKYLTRSLELELFALYKVVKQNVDLWMRIKTFCAMHVACKIQRMWNIFFTFQFTAMFFHRWKKTFCRNQFRDDVLSHNDNTYNLHILSTNILINMIYIKFFILFSWFTLIYKFYTKTILSFKT